MALNFSHRPIFPAHLSEDNLVSPIRMASGYLVEGAPEKNGDGFVKPWHSNREIEDCFDYGRDRGERVGSQESVSSDILDLLPSDPFGMDISTTVTAITGWLEDLEVDYGGYGRGEVGTSKGDYELFAGLNFIWNNAMRFQALPGNLVVNDKSNMASEFDGLSVEKEIGDVSCHGGFGSACNVEDILCFGNENAGNAGQRIDEIQESSGSCSDGDGGVPHQALLFALGHNENAGNAGQRIDEIQESSGSCSDGDGGVPHQALHFALNHLGVRDLLAAEGVCQSLRSTVRSDPLLWRSIHIEQPLNEKITDDVLLLLTSRAQGNLQCLSLMECPRITDDGLKPVLERNLRLTKLSVPGCTRLSIEGIVNSLKDFKSMGAQGIKNLRIGGLYGVTQKHFDELKSLLGTDSRMQKNAHKPHFYHRGNFYLSCDDDRAIDIEMCPRCLNLRLVYDCPAESCRGKEHADQICRACTLCIQRCVQCGRCINDSEYEETFCLELLCSDCWKQQQKCQERQDRKVGPSKHAILHEPSCSFCLHG